MSLRPCVPSTRGEGNDSAWETESHFPKFLRNAVFHLSTRNPAIVQPEHIFGYLDYLSESGELEFPLDLTICTSIHKRCWVDKKVCISHANLALQNDVTLEMMYLLGNPGSLVLTSKQAASLFT